MDWFSAIVVYVIGWWLVFLATLPIGVRSQLEEGEAEEGTELGAPVNPQLGKKALWATIGAAIVTVLVAIVLSLGIFERPVAPWA